MASRNACEVGDGGLRVLLVGSGTRDHALAWSFSRSPRIADLHVVPGSVGMESLATCHPGVEMDDFDAIARIAREMHADVVIPGLEDLFAAGITDCLTEQGITCLGPTRDAARLETSKHFAKSLMRYIGIPTPAWRTHSSYAEALADIRQRNGPMVVKADGLAGGCGTYVCSSPSEARSALDQLWGDGQPPPGGHVVIEDVVSGREVSLMTLSDGTRVVPLPGARDYKRLGAGDTGPNTGGMGSYCPSDDLDPGQEAVLSKELVQPVVDELRKRGTPFRGVVFAGVMLTDTGPVVLEYNCRFGNPETQSLVRILDSDLLDLVDRAARGSLAGAAVRTTGDHAVSVCVAAPSYPDRFAEERSFPVRGVRDAAEVENVIPFIGFSDPEGNGDAEFMALGNRFVTVSATGSDRRTARERAYRAVARIDVEGAHFREDIGLDPD